MPLSSTPHLCAFSRASVRRDAPFEFTRAPARRGVPCANFCAHAPCDAPYALSRAPWTAAPWCRHPCPRAAQYTFVHSIAPLYGVAHLALESPLGTAFVPMCGATHFCAFSCAAVRRNTFSAFIHASVWHRAPCACIRASIRHYTPCAVIRVPVRHDTPLRIQSRPCAAWRT